MNKFLVILIFILLLGGGLFYYWFTYEKPVQEEIKQYVNLNIYAVDHLERYVATNFSIFIDGMLYVNGKTLKDGVILVKVPLNSNLILQNVNRDNQYFYQDVSNLLITENDTRAKIRLISPSELNVTLDNKMEKEGILNFTLNTSNEFRDVMICLKWTNNFIYVKSDYNLMEKIPERYYGYDKCYTTDVSVNSTTNQKVFVKYKVWGSLTPKDFLQVAFIDSENNIISKGDNDEFAKDSIYVLNINNI